MVMDDPWGSSPWADDVQLPNPIKIEEYAHQPTTPVRLKRLGLEERLNSPWGNDDDSSGFGNWAAFPEDTQQTAGLDGTADGSGKQLRDVENPTVSESKDLSVAWDSQSTTGCEGTSFSDLGLTLGAPTISRQPSPDPWAVEVQTGEQESEEIRGGDILPVCSKVPIPRSNRSEVPVLQDRRLSVETLVRNECHENGENTTIGDGHPEANASDLNTDEYRENHSGGLLRLESQESDPVSRPSSSPSEHSQHEELSQESPRTSFDEEPKFKRPETSRKVSTKVHELVQHLDILAKTDDDEPAANRSVSADSAKSQELEDESDISKEYDDFGDFEEGQSDDEGAGLDDPQPTMQTSSEIHDRRTDQHQEPTPSEIALKRDYGIVEYAFEASKLESIFSSSTPQSTSENIFIPDLVPSDNFTSAEQRKIWHRISRYGTKRKHDNGNDENYVRAGWKPSTVREDTLKIVSRWIEEDRISGRVVLGGGSKGSTVFGWNNPKAPAVPLSDVFVKHRKRMSTVSSTAKPASVVPREWPQGLARESSDEKPHIFSSKPRRTSSINAVSAPKSFDVQDSPVPYIPSFGWNSGSGDTNADASRLSPRKTSSFSRTDSRPPGAALAPLKSQPSHPLISLAIPSYNVPSQDSTTTASTDDQISLVPQHNPIHTGLSMSNVFNEDDDWGEMVSTPATPALPVVPQSRGLRHKKSQSFGVMRPSQTQGGSHGWNNDEHKKTHRSITSFEGIRSQQILGPTFSSHCVPPIVDLSTVPLKLHEGPQPPPSDPWVSADFSIFDTAPAPLPIPFVSLISKAAGPAMVKVHAPPPAPARNQKLKEEVEQDRIVQSVVKGLPDLSYMLRK
ncbi:uncharacterized protein RSE6_03206 [Rhynchosporium secalis]|uniref:Uncharacterized protein n=1 Tax=Rhynchosporium secalis TaxID=38038 RepID=A0A1E1M275_RHYSE|nr:uncharacterized protein RSE6_03206 [Rhynchosporium secalis]